MMEILVILVPLALGLGLVGLLGFLWSLRSGQYDDLEGAAWRAISDDEPAPSSDDSDLAGRGRGKRQMG
jgi:cbb3-type cytochrome oxidase maturation protein